MRRRTQITGILSELKHFLLLWVPWGSPQENFLPCQQSRVFAGKEPSFS